MVNFPKTIYQETELLPFPCTVPYHGGCLGQIAYRRCRDLGGRSSPFERRLGTTSSQHPICVCSDLVCFVEGSCSRLSSSSSLPRNNSASMFSLCVGQGGDEEGDWWYVFTVQPDPSIKSLLSPWRDTHSTTEYKLQVCLFAHVCISKCASCYLTIAPPAQVAEGETNITTSWSGMQQQHTPCAR